ncbi:hypothetical protein HispidOSU_030471, partial [Sigmodon hispidus]
ECRIFLECGLMLKRSAVVLNSGGPYCGMLWCSPTAFSSENKHGTLSSHDLADF